MDQLSILKNWIQIAIQQPLDDKSEKFYYDKSNKEFFSILVIDYLLFDNKFNLKKDISLYFTLEEIELISKRLKEIHKKKSSILLLPRYGVIENQKKLSEIINQFTTEYKIDMKASRIFEVYQKEPITKKVIIKKPWWKFF